VALRARTRGRQRASRILQGIGPDAADGKGNLGHGHFVETYRQSL
jgi:hypothetical protein